MKTLLVELERPREVTPQVARHLAANYGTTDDEIGAFLEERLPGLEDDEVDLILSPLFTPTLDDQAIFAPLLGTRALSADEQDVLIANAVARPTEATFVTADGHGHRYRLGDVTVDRYVRRLRLEGAISPVTSALIERFPIEERGLIQAVARRRIWETGDRRSVLDAFLKASAIRESRRPDDVRTFLDVVERYKPADRGDLMARIPVWCDGLRGDLRAAADGKPFFDAGIERSHGGERDQRSSLGALYEEKRRDLEFLGQLEQLLSG